MENKDTRFENISMTGRLCYIFMCIERYLLAVYPDKDWTVIAKKMWQWTKQCWSDGWWEYGDVVPGHMLKYKNFEEVGFPNTDITREEFEALTSLYKSIPIALLYGELSTVLNIPFVMGNICDVEDYKSKIGEEETMKAIASIEEILKSHGIELPDFTPVSEYIKHDPRDAARQEKLRITDRSEEWGQGIDADHLSIILNKDETFMDAKRGYVPKDKRDFSPTAVEKMRTTSRHILYLINEGYDLKSASTFVGNHYKLTERQRLAIARSIATTGQLAVRKAKEKSAIAGEEVWIDGFNTVITLEVMLSDSMLFSCMDGCIRDLAALRGTYRIIDETKDAVRILMDSLAEMNVSAAHILLDEPVSNSGRLKALIADIKEELRERCPFCLDIQLLKDVDRSLWQKANVITSDSIILDHCISWLNLMKSLIEQKGTKTLRVWEQS